MIYEYRCNSCGQVTQQVRSMLDSHPEITPCQYCDGSARRIYSNVVIADAQMKRDRKFGHFSDSLPTDAPGANEYDAEGRPRIESRQHAHEIAARNGYQWR